ncbi:MAG: DUF4214 domain-containing protein [Clostridia bacterium]|nr:DUF4214 domain-containing protein [Clostridia bacterium]
MKRFLKVVATTLCAGMVLSSGLFVSSPIVNAAGGVAINEKNFPDERFREYVINFCNPDGDSVLSQAEIDSVNYIEVCERGIKSLQGIEHFTALTDLLCGDNELTSLDVSKNIQLVKLSCYNNQLTSLDISKNEKLEDLNCESNQLINLNVSKNTELYSLSCGENELVSLDISKNVKLVFLGCDYSKLTNLDVTKNINLTTLICFGNQLTSLDVSKNITLTDLECYENKITSLDVTKNINLEDLICFGNQLTNLDVSKNTKLIRLQCDDNQLTSLDVSKNTKLTDLYCSINQLTSLDVTKNNDLKNLSCFGNQLTVLDVSKNIALSNLECYENKLTSLDVSKNLELQWLYCDDNQLTSLDLSKNSKLASLYCSNNMITSLDISNNTELCNRCKNSDYVTEYTLYEKFYRGIIWLVYVEHIDYEFMQVVIDSQTTLTANGEVLYLATSTPTPAPTTTPTSGPIPTVVPTTAPEQSVGSFVDRCYEVALGREADDAGFEYWLDALNSGKICGAQAGYGFIFSGEYINKNRTNEEFVTDLYSMYFGRTPDSAGFNYWVDQLNSGEDRENVFAGFANSQEFDNLCAKYGVVTGTYIVGIPNDQQGGVNSFVARLYQVCLNRLPDMGGQAGWVDKLIKGEVTGTTCAFGFVFSPEFIGKEPSNEEFVAYMYRAFFGREADEAGFNAWVDVLNGGGSYADVFKGFSGSAEFANLCASYGIQA